MQIEFIYKLETIDIATRQQPVVPRIGEQIKLADSLYCVQNVRYYYEYKTNSSAPDVVIFLGDI